MGIVYFFIACGIFVVLIGLLGISEQWIRAGYQKLSPWLRWLLFLPISAARSIALSIAIFANTQIIFRLNEHFSLLVNWIAAPIFFFYTVGITIPKGKKVIPLAFAILWGALGALEAIKFSEYRISRILQTLFIVVFIIVWFRLPKNEIFQEESLLDQQDDNRISSI